MAILDRAFGKPRQELEVSGPEGGPVEIERKVPPVQSDQLADVLAVLSQAGAMAIQQAREDVE